MKNVILIPIGIVRHSLIDNTKKVSCKTLKSEGMNLSALIEIDPQWNKGLEGLIFGQDLWVICYLHLNPISKLLVHPRGDQSRPLTGVFNTRSSKRPCSISLNLVRLINIVKQSPNNIYLVVDGLENIKDGTPVLDLKPYMRKLDQPKEN